MKIVALLVSHLLIAVAIFLDMVGAAINDEVYLKLISIQILMGLISIVILQYVRRNLLNAFWRGYLLFPLLLGLFAIADGIARGIFNSRLLNF